MWREDLRGMGITEINLPQIYDSDAAIFYRLVFT